jgi:hypothetical protein
MESRMRTPKSANSKKKLLQCSKGFEKKSGFTLRAIESAVLSLDGSVDGPDPRQDIRKPKFVVFKSQREVACV